MLATTIPTEAAKRFKKDFDHLFPVKINHRVRHEIVVGHPDLRLAMSEWGEANDLFPYRIPPITLAVAWVFNFNRNNGLFSYSSLESVLQERGILYDLSKYHSND